MKPLYLAAVVLALVVVGCKEEMGFGSYVQTLKNRPLEVKIVNAPSADLEAKVKELEARVKTLEAWAVKQGGRMR